VKLDQRKQPPRPQNFYYKFTADPNLIDDPESIQIRDSLSLNIPYGIKPLRREHRLKLVARHKDKLRDFLDFSLDLVKPRLIGDIVFKRER
jgi:hypothetical protein